MRQVLAGVLLGLVIGGLVGFAAGRTGGDVEPESVAPGATRTPAGAAVDDPPVVRRDPLRPRSRVAPPALPVERPHPARGSSPSADSPAEDAAEPARPSGEILHELAAALRSEAPLDATHVQLASGLAASPPDPRPGLELVDLALSRSQTDEDAGRQIAFILAGLLDPEAAFDAVQSALAGTHPRRIGVIVALAEAAGASVRDTTALAAALLAHSDPDARSAGVALADEDPDLSGMLLDVARRDANDWVRAEAISSLVWGLETLDAEERRAASRAITPVVLLAAREGRGNLRRTAVAWLPELGPEAADTALALIRAGGLDDEMLDYAVNAVLPSGRSEELFAADDSDAVLDKADWWVRSNDLGPDEIAVHLSLLRHLIRKGGADARGNALSTLAYAGAIDEIDRIAGEPEFPGTTRAAAIEWLLTADLDEGDSLRRAEQIGVRRMRELLDPGRTEATTRTRLLRGFVEGQARILTEPALTESLALLRSVARNDPSAWVRDAAEEASWYLSDE